MLPVILRCLQGQSRHLSAGQEPKDSRYSDRSPGTPSSRARAWTNRGPTDLLTTTTYNRGSGNCQIRPPTAPGNSGARGGPFAVSFESTQSQKACPTADKNSLEVHSEVPTRAISEPPSSFLAAVSPPTEDNPEPLHAVVSEQPTESENHRPSDLFP